MLALFCRDSSAPVGEGRGEGSIRHSPPPSKSVRFPIFFNASRFFSVSGSATPIRRQLRYFPEGGNSDLGRGPDLQPTQLLADAHHVDLLRQFHPQQEASTSA